jgi:hypothetical protein
MKPALALIFTVLALCVCGQRKASAKAHAPKWIVPPVIEHKFNVENPEATAVWSKDGSQYSARFVNPINNLGSILVYDTTGKEIRREKELENSDYPAPINDYFMNKYPGEGYAVWSSTDSEGNSTFYSQHNDHTIRFDKNGHLVAPISLRPGASDSVMPSIAR